MGNCNIFFKYLIAIFLCVSLAAGRFLTPGIQGSKPKGVIFFKPNHDLPEITRVKAFTDVQLSCQVGGSPPPTVHWTYDTKRIEQGGMLDNRNDEAYYEDSEDRSGNPLIRRSYTNALLYLDCITPDMQGDYECVAEAGDKTIVSRTTLIVDDSVDFEADSCLSKRNGGGKIAARPFLWTSTRIEKNGATVQLFCRGEGNPQPSTMWLDNKGREITEDREGYELLPNGDLLIRNLGWGHMGSFKCIVGNTIGKAKTSTFLYPAAKS